MNTIVPKKYKTLNCIENCIANVCDANAIDFRPMFLYSWDIGYDTSKNTIGERLHYRFSSKINFTDYMQISEEYMHTAFVDGHLNFNVVNEVDSKDRICLIETDSYYCSWNAAYNKYHYPHYYLLLQNSYTDRDFIIIDSFSSLQMIKCDSTTLKNIKKCYSIIQKNCGFSFPITNIKKKFIDFVAMNTRNNVYEQINMFGSDLMLLESIYDLSPQIVDIPNSHIIRRLSYLSNARYNTALLMNYINLDSSFIERMNLIHRRWESLKNYFIKVLVTKNIQMIPLAKEMINVLATEENDLARIISKEIN